MNNVVSWVVAMLWAYMPISVLATTWYVNGTTGSDSYAGTIRTLAKKTIQAAVDASSNGDTILVAPGTYTGSNYTSESGLRWVVLLEKRKLTIKSETGAASTIISAQSRSKKGGCGVFNCGTKGNDVTFEGFTIRDGASGACGGRFVRCVICNNANGVHSCSAVIDCLIKNNSWSSDAQIVKTACYQSSLYNCTIVGNYCSSDGSTVRAGACWCALYNCIVSGNGVFECYSYNSIINGNIPDQAYVSELNGTDAMAASIFVNASPTFHVQMKNPGVCWGSGRRSSLHSRFCRFDEVA